MHIAQSVQFFFVLIVNAHRLCGGNLSGDLAFFYFSTAHVKP